MPKPTTTEELVRALPIDVVRGLAVALLEELRKADDDVVEEVLSTKCPQCGRTGFKGLAGVSMHIGRAHPGSEA